MFTRYDSGGQIAAVVHEAAFASPEVRIFGDPAISAGGSLWPPSHPQTRWRSPSLTS